VSFENRFSGEHRATPRNCDCVDQTGAGRQRRVRFHGDRQDTTAPGWLRLLQLIDEAAADGREEFRPFTELSTEERDQVITLPAAIGRLTAVRHLVLYGSNLVRIPPEIRAMSALRQFTPYTSYRLHWYPYELTRCRQLAGSTVSTRALYGNEKTRPPFPELADAVDAPVGDADPGVWGAEAVRRCSVCDGPVVRVHQRWLSMRVATDVLPLLVNACSAACVAALPAGHEDHVRTPHLGGPSLVQPAGDWD